MGSEKLFVVAPKALVGSLDIGKKSKLIIFGGAGGANFKTIDSVAGHLDWNREIE